MTDAPVPPDLAAMRTAYDGRGLREGDLAPTPLAQFTAWLADAVAAGVAEPNAMVLATVDEDGTPSARTVLLKGADARGFSFYTNLGSRKARALAARPQASVVFPWHAMTRQVVVVGDVAPVPREEARAYFASRPYGSRIGAWASEQSRVIASRDVLTARYVELAAAFPDTGSADDVPLPDGWGGFVLAPRTVELWQGRPSRLHDRLRYVRREEAAGVDCLDDPDAWTLERLSP
ncbi:MAG: pyridoxamine 5'-phosphate oxidase [Frankiales bacterium]|nr:pyridoxamine 5'-phosphate oxidase [Frankiales bacterium]